MNTENEKITQRIGSIKYAAYVLLLIIDLVILVASVWVERLALLVVAVGIALVPLDVITGASRLDWLALLVVVGSSIRYWVAAFKESQGLK